MSETINKKYKPVLLAILDGWGIGKKDDTDAVSLANTPNLDKLLAENPMTKLVTNGRDVGLPTGIMGNSEVGHQNIGAGRIVYQSLVKINIAIEDGSFFTNTVIDRAYQDAKKNESAIHFIGLLSDGGVHSTEAHLWALVEKAKTEGLSNVYVHALMDGRDTDPKSGQTYMKKLVDKMNEIGVGEVATVCGRYYAMDRDNNFDRVKIAYDAMVNGVGESASDPVAFFDDRYNKDETDEFIHPTVLNKDGIIKAGDSVVFFNYRPDRARELSKCLINKVDNDETKSFDGISSPDISFVSMTQYQEGLTPNVAFSPEKLSHTMGEVISSHGLKQLRIAETEKYAHVTFFFNGGAETVFEGEDRILVASPKEVQGLYNKKPEMSIYEVTEKLLAALDKGIYDFIVLNYANCDMVGHTGIMKAAIQAVEDVDTCVGKLLEKVASKHGVMLVTADHGNADLMKNPDGSPMTAHSMNLVPLAIAGVEEKITLKEQGCLADISPTILEIMNIEQPAEMTGNSLII